MPSKKRISEKTKTYRGALCNHKFTDFAIEVPRHDCDITLKFANGKTVIVQCRPSNADIGYNGSMDFILPENAPVICWIEDMQPGPQVGESPETRLAQQLVMDLPCGPDDEA